MAGTMTKDVLKQAVRNGGVLRVVRELEPEGGPGEMVRPAIYADRTFALEERNGVKRVQVNSIPAEANRMEAALRDVWEQLGLPELTIVNLDEEVFGVSEKLAFELPNRLADPAFRNSSRNGVPFAEVPEVRAALQSSPERLTPMLNVSPMSLVFGTLNISDPVNSQKIKLARIVQSRIMADVSGEAVSGLLGSSGWGFISGTGLDNELYRNERGGISFEPPTGFVKANAKAKERAKAEKGDNQKPKPVKSASELNISPAIGAPQLIGFYADRIEQIASISLSLLARYKFPLESHDPEKDVVARTVLAALALYGLVGASQNYFIRSGCTLLPQGPIYVEAVTGVTPSRTFIATPQDTFEALLEAISDAKAAGFFDQPSLCFEVDETFREAKIRHDSLAAKTGDKGSAGVAE